MLKTIETRKNMYWIAWMDGWMRNVSNNNIERMVGKF
jgi:hypothetical protein